MHQNILPAKLLDMLDNILDGADRALFSAVDSLLKNHEAQWMLEDVCRGITATDVEIGAAKRGIDQCNRARVNLINLIDEMVFTGSDTPYVGSERYPLTIGQMIDLIQIQSIRTRHLDTVDSHGLLSHLVGSFEDLIPG